MLMPCAYNTCVAASQSFHSRQGKAYLFNEVVNVSEGPREERLMTTGACHCSQSCLCQAPGTVLAQKDSFPHSDVPMPSGYTADPLAVPHVPPSSSYISTMHLRRAS